jgi:hypothetical protein
MAMTIQAGGGGYLTAINGGGFEAPNDTPFHTDAVAVGPWEEFVLERQHDGRVAIRTSGGFYVTAVDNGLADKFGGKRDLTQALSTYRSHVAAFEQFEIEDQGNGRVAIRTATGNYLTAMEGGGWGEAANQTPLHTDATVIGPWELFRFADPPPATVGSWQSFSFKSTLVSESETPGVFIYEIKKRFSAVGTVDLVRGRLSGLGSTDITLRIGGQATGFPNEEETSAFRNQDAGIIWVTSGLYHSGANPISGKLEILISP